MGKYTPKTKEADLRGGRVFVQVDIYKDQDDNIKKRVKNKGGSRASSIRDGLDLLFKDEDNLK